jgi:predicted ATP-grasp superfamily ATP-dependent carboligase
MPVGLDTFTLSSKFKEDFEKYTDVPVVSYDRFIRAHDKGKVQKIATKLNIPTPVTYTPNSVDEALEYTNELSFPIVVKARKGTGTSQVTYAKSKNDLKRIYQLFVAKAKADDGHRDIVDYTYPLLQEYLPGDIFDVLVLYNDGVLKANVAQQRLLCYPTDGGSGALNITVDYPEIIRYTRKLMSHLKWHGVAMIEYKMNADNKPHLLEVNPKFWGTSGLAISAGVNFPFLLYKLTTNGDIPKQNSYLSGKVHGWPFPMRLNHLIESKSKARSFKVLLRLLTQRNTTDINFRDLSPLGWELQLTIRSIARHIFRKRRSQPIAI